MIEVREKEIKKRRTWPLVIVAIAVLITVYLGSFSIFVIAGRVDGFPFEGHCYRYLGERSSESAEGILAWFYGPAYELAHAVGIEIAYVSH